MPKRIRRTPLSSNNQPQEPSQDKEEAIQGEELLEALRRLLFSVQIYIQC
jgi:hypothetical protein